MAIALVVIAVGCVLATIMVARGAWDVSMEESVAQHRVAVAKARRTEVAAFDAAVRPTSPFTADAPVLPDVLAAPVLPSAHADPVLPGAHTDPVLPSALEDPALPSVLADPPVSPPHGAQPPDPGSDQAQNPGRPPSPAAPLAPFAEVFTEAPLPGVTRHVPPLKPPGPGVP